jgi:hypothetical protein
MVRFKVFKLKVGTISSKSYLEAKDIHNSYIPYIPDFPDLNNLVYILDVEPFKSKALKEFDKLGLKLIPAKTNLLNETSVDMYVGEDEITKCLEKIQKDKIVEVGSIVRVPEYKLLPFKVRKVEGDLVELYHELKDMEISIQVTKDVCEVLDEEDDYIFYKETLREPPHKKLYLDCDVLEEEDSILNLFNDMLILGMIYNGYQIILLNPLPNQLPLAKLLGLGVIRGDKRALVQNKKHFDGEVDLIYSDSLDLLLYVNQLVVLQKTNNMLLPSLITKDSTYVDCDKIPKPKNLKKSVVLDKAIVFRPFEELKYSEIKAYFKERGYTQFLGDLAYYIKVIKS